MARIILEDQNGRYEINPSVECVTIGDYFEKLVDPVLLAAGFSQKLINDCMGIDE